MKWAILILFVVGFGLTFLLRDARRLEGSPDSAPRAEAVRSEARRDDSSAGHVYYQYTSDTGDVRFATSLENVPPEKRATSGRVRMDAPPPTSRREAREARDRSAGVDRATASLGLPTVTIYTSATCPYCRSAMRYLDKIGQPYTNRDVELDPGAYEDYLRKTGGREGVPVIDVDGKILQGWDRDRLDALLGRS